MKYFLSVLTLCAMTFITGTQTLAAEDLQASIAPLRESVVQRLDQLKSLRKQAESRRITTAYADVSIRTAELFLTYADWDRQHPRQLAEVIGKYAPVASQADALAQALPGKELQDTKYILDVAIDTLQARLSGSLPNREVPIFTGQPVERRGAYFYQENKPVFPYGLVWMPGNQENVRAFGTLLEKGGVPIASLPKSLQKDYSMEGFNAITKVGVLFDVYMGGPAPAKWMVKEHPEILDGKRGHTHFDIDNPLIRQWHRAWYRQLLSKTKDLSRFAHIYLLANEPGFPTRKDGWEADNGVSSYTWMKFRWWLAGRYKRIEKLNEVWNRHFNSFDQIQIEMPIPGSLRGGPIWYDWCRFNMDRVSDWYAFLVQTAHQNDPKAMGMIKTGLYLYAKDQLDWGNDYEKIYRLQDVIGVETRFMPAKIEWDSNTSRVNMAQQKGYALKWTTEILSLDFAMSIAPHTPIYDSEAHLLSSEPWRNSRLSAEYVQACQWLAYLHGVGATNLWHWDRQTDGAPISRVQSGFYGTTGMQPIVLDAFGQVMKQLNAFGSEVVALAKNPKQVWVYYTDASAIQDPDAYLDGLLNINEALNLQGFSVGYVTPALLEKAEGEVSNAGIRTKFPFIVLPEAKFITSHAIKLLANEVAKGAKIVRVGKQFYTKDEHGKARSATLVAFLDSAPELALQAGDLLANPLRLALSRQGLEARYYCQFTDHKTTRESSNVPKVVTRWVQEGDQTLVSLICVGDHEVSVKLDGRANGIRSATDLLSGLSVDLDRIKLKPCQIMLLDMSTP